jgi:hypothetical protein
MTTETGHNDLFEKTIAVSISYGAIYNQRRTSLVGVEVDADKDRLNMNAKILQCPEMKAIRGTFAKTREMIVDAKKGLTLPALFKRGVSLVPVAKIGEVEAILTARRTELAAHVEELIAVYDQRIAEDKQRLRSKFDITHYPAKEALRDTFTISWRYLQLTPSTQLKAISSDVYAKEVERVKAECAALGEQIKQSMRAAALELVTKMHERLGNNEDGTPKVFKASTVSNLVTFLENFEYRNVTDDSELAATLAEVTALLKGVDADGLRNNEGLRQALTTQIGGIVGELDKLVTVQNRVVVLPDEDDSEAA